MDVISHNHIATDCDVEGFVGALGKNNERSMDLIVCQQSLSFVCAKGDEIKRSCCKDASQTWWPPAESPLHARSVATALRAVQSKDVVPLVSFTGHRPVATASARL